MAVVITTNSVNTSNVSGINSITVSTGQNFRAYDAQGNNDLTIDTAGNVIIPGSNTATGTASQPLQVTGSVYISGNLGIGSTNPTSKLQSSGQLQITQANSTTTGGGQIYLNGLTGNRIDFNQNGVAAPAFTTRSAGTKLVLYPNIGAASVDYALGIDNNTLWYSVSTTGESHKWYAGTTNIATLTGGGLLQFNSGYGSVATAYGCRAWVNFNGTGVVAIRGSGNVTSITDNNLGDYTVNFTTAMPDVNYVAVLSCTQRGGASSPSQNSSLGYGSALTNVVDSTYSTTQLRIYAQLGGGNAIDPPTASVAIFR